MFGERGYQNASMDAVAERVGVTKPVLYTHFGSKDGLLLACIARARAELLEVTTAAAASACAPRRCCAGACSRSSTTWTPRAPAWTLLYSESTVAGDALEGIRAQQTDFIAALLAAQAPDAEPQRLTGWAQVIVGACERLAVWRDPRRRHGRAPRRPPSTSWTWSGPGAGRDGDHASKPMTAR